MCKLINDIEHVSYNLQLFAEVEVHVNIYHFHWHKGEFMFVYTTQKPERVVYSYQYTKK